MHNPSRSLSLLIASATLACGALAQSDGPRNTVKLGVIVYQPHAKTSGITGLGVPAGADASVGSATTLVGTYEREVGPNLGIELVLGVPPTITARGAGSVAFLGEVLSVKNVAPTVLLNYHFGDAGNALRPYVGIGINYTRFTDAKSPYGWDVRLSDSWGLAAQVGVDYALGRRWGLFASIGAAQVKSDVVAVGASVLRTTIDFRPITYAAGVAYKF